MSLMSYTALVGLVQRGVITGVEDDCINSTSIDITLGTTLQIERGDNEGPGGPVSPYYALAQHPQPIGLRERTPLAHHQYTMDYEEGYVLRPGEFVLAHSVQVFNLPPTISAEYKLKSSMARIGLEHLNAGWCDAGWHGSTLTLELKNMTRAHSIRIRPGDRIGQVVFFKHDVVPANRSYAVRGRYNNDVSVSGVKE